MALIPSPDTIFPTDIWNVISVFLATADIRKLILVCKSISNICLKILVKRLNALPLRSNLRVIWEWNYMGTPRRLEKVMFGRLGVPYFIMYDGIRDYFLCRFGFTDRKIHVLSVHPFTGYSASCTNPDGSLLIVSQSVVLHFSYRGHLIAKLFKLPFAKITKILVDQSGNIVTLNQEKKTIVVFDSSGKILSEIGSKNSSFPLKNPTDLAVAPDNRYWVVDAAGGKLVAFQPDGSNPQQIATPEGCNISIDVSIICRADLILVLHGTDVYGFKQNGDALGIIGTSPYLYHRFQGTLSPTGRWYMDYGTFYIHEYIKPRT